ncbi:MAG: glycosyltransferase family 4 protein [Synergistaceae bacterium]|nr:glycosyltransferase family 4 protein [Synergistaceae bacterium]
MQKIIINGRFLAARLTGSQRYSRELVMGLDNISSPDEFEIAIPPETVNVPDYKNIKVTSVGKLHNRAWEHISFPIYVKKKGAISLNLCNTAPLISPGIVVIHDMRIKARPHDLTKKFLLWYRLLFANEMKRARAIITVSEFSKREIMKYYHIAPPPERITVIPNAWQHYLRIPYSDDALSKYNLESGKFFFSISSIEPNKNLNWLAQAAKKYPDEIFAVAGGINKNVYGNGLNFEYPNNMKLIGYVSDSEAKTLMRECKGFIFPTFYEGFGIPPLEALSAGAKRVLVSDTEIMHEVYGDSVEYINPYEPILPDPVQTTAADLVLKKYSWEKSAAMLYDLLRKL